jgi:hypothetical protein
MSLRPSIYEHIEENGRTYHRFKQGSKFVLKLWVGFESVTLTS